MYLYCAQDSSADAIDQLNVDNEREREELMSKIEVETKEAKQEVVHQYMSHYLLGLKVKVYIGSIDRYIRLLPASQRNSRVNFGGLGGAVSPPRNWLPCLLICSPAPI